MIRNFVIYLLFFLPILGLSQPFQYIMVQGTVTSTTGAPVPNQIVYIATSNLCSSSYSGSTVTATNGFYGNVVQINPLAFSCNLYITTYNCGVTTSQVVTITPNTSNILVNLQLPCLASCSANFIATDSAGFVTCSNLSSGTNDSTFTSSWTVDGIGSGNATNPVFQLYSGTHTICLTITDNTNCTNTYCDYVYVQTGSVSAVASSNTLQFVKVYPNPVSDNAVLNLNLKESTKLEVSLQNIMGQVVWVKAEKMAEGEQEISFSMRDLPKGIYILKVNADGVTQEMKVVKE